MRLLLLILLLVNGLWLSGQTFPVILQDIRPGTTTVIDKVIDLQGLEWHIPREVTLRFARNASIINGCIVGSSTRIIAKKKHRGVFQNVIIKGSWIVPNVYSEWLDFAENENNTRQVRNLFHLCSSDVDNVVHIQSGSFFLDGYDSVANSPSIILVPSNTTIVNKATFRVLPHSNVQSFLFYFRDVSNCSWRGGKLMGDINDHLSDTWEQGFGFDLRGAHNITIQDVECADFWGDGINLQYSKGGYHNENILIESVRCNNNRRQGISIEDGINVRVNNSNFSGTGSFRGTPPMKGIDVEPYYKEAVINGIRITNCTFSNNVGGGLSCSYIKSSDSEIIICDCMDINGGLRINDCRIDNNAKGIIIDNYQCPAGKLQFKRVVQNVMILNSTFMSALTETSNVDRLSNVEMNGVTFRTSEQRTWNYYCLSLVCAEMDNVLFNGCHFEILKGSTLSSVFPSGGDWSGALIKNSVIVDHRGRSMFVPCDIINSKIECESGLSFTNCKKEADLFFVNNEVTIRQLLEGSPFVFHSSSHPFYTLIGNTIHHRGNLDHSHLIQLYKTNKIAPTVVLRSNKYVN